MREGSEGTVTSLELRRARRFLKHLDRHPFVALVVTPQGLKVFSKDFEGDALETAQNILGEAVG